VNLDASSFRKCQFNADSDTTATHMDVVMVGISPSINIANNEIAWEATSQLRRRGPELLADMLSVLSSSMPAVLARDIREIQR
jgi:hypothetical protein